MPLIFPTPSEVSSNAAWQTALRSEKFGNPKIAGRTHLLELLNKAHVWARRSRTAQAVLSTVIHARPDIYLVGMRNGGYSCFDSDTPVDHAGTIYFNLDVVLKVRIRDGVDTTTMVRLKDGSMRPSREPKYKADKIDVDPLIAFLHEFGHAKQFIEMPDMFTRRAHKTGKKIEEISASAIEEAARHWASGLGKESDNFLKDTKFKFSSKRPVNPEPKKFVAQPERPTYVKTRLPANLNLGSNRLTKPAWGVKIETDNLINHEWPICREMGWPDGNLRHYTDIEEIIPAPV